MKCLFTILCMSVITLHSLSADAQLRRRQGGVSISYNCFAVDLNSSDEYLLRLPVVPTSVVDGVRTRGPVNVNENNPIKLRDNREGSSTRFATLFAAIDPKKFKTKKLIGDYGYHYEILGDNDQSDLVVFYLKAKDMRKAEVAETYWINEMGTKIDLRLSGCVFQ